MPIIVVDQARFELFLIFDCGNLDAVLRKQQILIQSRSRPVLPQGKKCFWLRTRDLQISSLHLPVKLRNHCSWDHEALRPIWCDDLDSCLFCQSSFSEKSFCCRPWQMLCDWLWVCAHHSSVSAGKIHMMLLHLIDFLHWLITCETMWNQTLNLKSHAVKSDCSEEQCRFVVFRGHFQGLYPSWHISSMCFRSSNNCANAISCSGCTLAWVPGSFWLWHSIICMTHSPVTPLKHSYKGIHILYVSHFRVNM